MKLGLLILAFAVLLIIVVSAANADRVDRLSDKQLAREAQKVIEHGGIRSTRYGDVTPYLRRLCHEMIDRAFAPYGASAVSWARYVVRRESRCNPAAVNHKYSSRSQQATGIAQWIPAYHTWIDYERLVRDLKYAVAVFVRSSRGGRNTGPWRCC